MLGAEPPGGPCLPGRRSFQILKSPPERVLLDRLATGFENYGQEAQRIEQEIIRHGIVLGINWDDPAAVQALAREALACHPGEPGCDPDTPMQRAKIELFGLAQLMLTVMAESADADIATHGGTVWKAFGRALWRESGLG
jgi:hypothetical protein